ncbi:MAG: glutaredoxin family protein [Solirubrobacteraceae bacterium]
MSKITVYTTQPCAHCATAKAILQARGVSYAEVNLSKDPVGRAELAQRTGLMTFPQIVVGEQTLGGLNELRAADADGSLQQLLAA